jgi:hypothetical protein
VKRDQEGNQPPVPFMYRTMTQMASKANGLEEKKLQIVDPNSLFKRKV